MRRSQSKRPRSPSGFDHSMGEGGEFQEGCAEADRNKKRQRAEGNPDSQRADEGQPRKGIEKGAPIAGAFGCSSTRGMPHQPADRQDEESLWTFAISEARAGLEPGCWPVLPDRHP